jgi:hypothetical protein
VKRVTSSVDEGMVQELNAILPSNCSRRVRALRLRAPNKGSHLPRNKATSPEDGLSAALEINVDGVTIVRAGVRRLAIGQLLGARQKFGSVLGHFAAHAERSRDTPVAPRSGSDVSARAVPAANSNGQSSRVI